MDEEGIIKTEKYTFGIKGKVVAVKDILQIFPSPSDNVKNTHI